MGVSTSSRRYLWRRHLWFKMAAPEMTSTRTWGTFFDPYCGGGGKWRPFRFRSPSWMTSFPVPQMRSSKMAAGSGRVAIFHHHHNGDRKKYPILLTLSTTDRLDTFFHRQPWPFLLQTVLTTGATPAKNTANTAGSLRNALTARNTLEGTKRFSGAVWISTRNGQRTERQVLMFYI